MIAIETTQNKTKGTFFKQTNSKLWDHSLWPVIGVSEVLEGERREGWEIKYLKKSWLKFFPNLIKTINLKHKKRLHET